MQILNETDKRGDGKRIFAALDVAYRLPVYPNEFSEALLSYSKSQARFADVSTKDPKYFGVRHADVSAYMLIC